MVRTPDQPKLTLVGDRPRDNRLLSALPDDALERILPMLQRVDLPAGAVLYESGELLDYAYFPSSSIVSLLYVTESGAAAEIAMVGSEGVLGIAMFLGGNTMPNRALVRSAGQGFRIRAKTLTDVFESSAPVMHLFLRYAQALITQIAQTAVCNRHHALDEQLSRWLLMNLDRIRGDEVAMTQELISNMLGVRRESVTSSASKLQAKGLIRYARGHIRVLDRAGLERQACECYSAVRREYERLLPGRAAR